MAKMKLVRRLLAVLLAVVMCMAVLASSPVGAANSAAESLFDHDGSARTSEVRRFAGPDRYMTSLALAEAFFESIGVDGVAGTLIVVSGESVVDAAAAAGLAAAEEAAVVFTRPGRTSRRLRDFIVDQAVSEVIIVGGVDAVTESVADEFAELATVRSVRRLAGADRYETAVLVAQEMGEIGDYCETPLRTAVLVNADSSLADVILAGPLAYASSMPVLLTGADVLPAGVVDYLADAGIEQVLVVGGATAVSEAVVDELAAVGISTRRISGEDRFKTAVAVVGEIDACVGVELSSSSVALVNAEFAAEGIAAGPTLGAGLGGDSAVTPVSLVSSGDTLPAATREYLRSTPIRESSSGAYTDLAITAIGGTDAVSAELMRTAIAAAITSAPLYVVSVEQNVTDMAANRWQIIFSDTVNLESSTSASWATSALNPANYLISGELLATDDRLARSTVATPGSLVFLTLAPALSFELEDDDEITILGGKISGANDDNRRVKEHTYVHSTAYKLDDVRPRVVIDAPADWHEFRLQITDENLSSSTLSDFNLASLTLNDAPLPATAEVEDGSTSDNIVVCLFGDGDPTDTDDATSPDTCSTTVPTGGSLLADGDTITLAAGAFVDRNNNSSRATTVPVTDASDAPELVGASVTEIQPHPARRAEFVWQFYYLNPDFIEQEKGMRDTNYPYATGNNVCDRDPGWTYRFRIQLRDKVKENEKEFTEFAGAFGNGWKLVWRQVNDLETAQNTAPNVNIIIARSREIMTIEFDEDSKILDVVKAIRAHSEADQIFSVTSHAEQYPDDPLLNIALNTILIRYDRFNPQIYPPNPIPNHCALGGPGIGPGYGEMRQPDGSLTHFGVGNPGAEDGAANINVYPLRSFRRGQSLVDVTLTFDQPVKSFDFVELIDVNAPIQPIHVKAPDNADTPGGYLGEINTAARDYFRGCQYGITTEESRLCDWFQGKAKCMVNVSFPTGYLDTSGSHDSFNNVRRWWEEPTLSDLTRTYTFRLNSDCLDLPKAGDTIKLPAGFATGYNDKTSEATSDRLKRQ